MTFPHGAAHCASSALAEAQRLARLFDEPHVVAVHIERTRPLFSALMLGSFARMRQRGTVADAAILAIVSPDGTYTVPGAFDLPQFPPPLPTPIPHVSALHE